jgi:parallel beta-helix repeat protein
MVVIAAQVLIAQPASAAQTIVVHNGGSIQDAINAASDGDTINVEAGTYVGAIHLNRGITIHAVDGPEVTVINGNGASPVVTIDAASVVPPVLSGFTVTGAGSGQSAILTTGGRATIEGNHVVNNNLSCNGSAIDIWSSDATVINNVVTDNAQTICPVAFGGGIRILFTSGALVRGNSIARNVANAFGGGIVLFQAGTTTIDGNTIVGNSARTGGGIMSFQSTGVITNNVLVRNEAEFGGGIAWEQSSTSPGLSVYNNTVVDNEADSGSAIFAFGFNSNVVLANNVLIGGGSTFVVECDSFSDAAGPIIRHNNVVRTTTGPKYGGVCTDQTGSNGNISVDPEFVNPAEDNYRLSETSPLIDKGTNTNAPTHDFDGRVRPVDGNGDWSATTDIGAFESLASPFVVITQNTTLSGDLSKPVVIAADNITLDCAGYAVQGPPASGILGSVGIRLDGHNGVTVKNCVISGFETGVRVVLAHANRLENNTANSNSFAGFVLGAAVNNVLIGNEASSNGLYGFDLSVATQGNRFEGNTVDSNGHSGFLVNNASDNVLIDNVIHGSGTNGIWMLSSLRNVVQGNQLQYGGGDGLRVEAGSNNNTIQDNTSVFNLGDGFEVNGSSNNSFIANRADENEEYGFRVVNASLNNRFTGNGGCENGIPDAGDPAGQLAFSDAFVGRSSRGNVWTQSQFCNTSGQFQQK